MNREAGIKEMNKIQWRKEKGVLSEQKGVSPA